MIPIENVKYGQLYPDPQNIPNHTYTKGAVVSIN